MSIEVSTISKYYGQQKALDKVSFSIKSGEIVGFLGPNGAGKSTMMRILTTYLNANEGTASVNGYDVVEEQREVQKSIGYLPENNPLYPDMYVKEYLSFSAEVYKLTDSKKRIDEVIEETGLTSHVGKKIQELSKGYKQRVGLANALLHRPKVLILDEPTTGLDPNQLVEIRQLIRKVGKNTTILLSTHIMQEVEAMCDRVIIINKGKIVADDYLKNLKSDAAQMIEVEFDYKVEPELLQQIDRVREVTDLINIPGFHYSLRFETKEDMRSAVFDFAHDHELKILSLNKRNKNLETMFTELTKE
ncbi:gliding motility-associated ABC transporter ATP-binding subunit GldA [Nonlabens sp. MB-3u-79]|uniref:gliding motility-associated ABC transporter ATP-binding subunit GldA n=1 Tax=Nonlabens sp. MB-3u-79 TaxID=2058134 RepID=UPI000C3148A5|nr:gliding motility-associated ABC transporter ATP-binding subunit GldA [Nonlabens sp. MB-3u-79]AUC78348.1 gliding motility-associated ABC transporter ATP-binding subunit GldA [Nonlabens sp. MB-3u-79]|tara:strand:+ start:90773 stop:91684 length:912 start_codon:yes stop_codon:yes gene_type:complete